MLKADVAGIKSKMPDSNLSTGNSLSRPKKNTAKNTNLCVLYKIKEQEIETISQSYIMYVLLL